MPIERNVEEKLLFFSSAKRKLSITGMETMMTDFGIPILSLHDLDHSNLVCSWYYWHTLYLNGE